MGPDSPITDLLFDYLYVDRNRLASLSSQLHKSGVLSSIKTYDSSTGQSGGRLDLGVPASLALNFSGGSATQSATEQNFDASWSLPLNVIDKLDELGFINRDISSTGIGNVFVAEGAIRFLDYRLMKDSWEDASAFAIADLQQKHKPPSQSEKENLKRTFKMLQRLPHSIELVLHTAHGMVWTCPSPSCLTVSSETLTFTHGSSIPGKWYMVATLDAVPASANKDEFERDAILDLMEKPLVKDLQIAMAGVAHVLREALGRPHQSYAATPLVIFRKVSPAAQIPLFENQDPA